MTFSDPEDLKDMPEPYGFIAFVFRVAGGVGGAVVTVYATIEACVYLYESVHPAAGYALAGVACLVALGISLLIEARYKEVSAE